LDSVAAAAFFCVDLAVVTAVGPSQHAYSCYNSAPDLSLDYVGELATYYAALAVAVVEIVQN
jgi:hypothetical protein